MEVVGVVEVQHQVPVHRARIARRLARAHARRQAFDGRLDVRAVEERDRVAVRAGVVQHPVRRRQKAVVRPALHDVAEVDQEGARDHRRGEPLAAGEADREPGHVLSREHRDERVVGVGPLTELLLVVGLLRRVVQEAQIDVRLVGEERPEVSRRHVERPREQGQYPLAQAFHGLEVADHRRPHRVVASGPLVSASERASGHDVRMVSAPVVADEEALVVVGPGRLVDRRGPLHALIHRQVADVVLVDLERELVG